MKKFILSLTVILLLVLVPMLTVSMLHPGSEGAPVSPSASPPSGVVRAGPAPRSGAKGSEAANPEAEVNPASSPRGSQKLVVRMGDRVLCDSHTNSEGDTFRTYVQVETADLPGDFRYLFDTEMIPAIGEPESNVRKTELYAGEGDTAVYSEGVVTIDGGEVVTHSLEIRGARLSDFEVEIEIEREGYHARELPADVDL